MHTCYMGLFKVQKIIFYCHFIICGRLFCSDTFLPECTDQDNKLRNCIGKYIKYIARMS